MSYALWDISNEMDKMDNKIDKVDKMDNFVRMGEPFNKTETYPGLISRFSIDTHKHELKICADKCEQLYNLDDIDEFAVKLYNLNIYWENGRKDEIIKCWYNISLNGKIIILENVELFTRYANLGRMKFHIDEIIAIIGDI